MNSKWIKSLLSVLILSIIIQTTQGQDIEAVPADSLLPKDAISASFGIGGLYVATIFYFEHKLGQPDRQTRLSPFLRGGVGFYGVWGIGGPLGLLEGGIITGAGKHHLEASLGINGFLTGDLQGGTAAASIGYRKQVPGKESMFRAGIGFPAAVYVGLGINLTDGK